MTVRPSLRAAVNRKCHDCIVDPLDHGTAAQQIACCISRDCPLHPVRPITAMKIPQRLLDLWRISAADLCGRASPLVEKEMTPVEARNGPVASAESISGLGA